jgi:MFS family permease
MFSVGVVLYVLDRTGSAAVAGATVAAVTLPSFLSGPVLGAWLDLTGRRRAIMVVDRTIMASALLGVLALAGSGPDWTLPLVAGVAGITYPLTFGGFTSLIPALVDEELLPAANALEATSLNLATIAGPALAGTIAAIGGADTALAVEAALTLCSLALIVATPSFDIAARRARSSLRAIVVAGLRQLAAVPALRGVTVSGTLNLFGLGLLTVTFPFFAESLGADRSVAGHLWAAFAAGSILGALSAMGFQRRFAPERVVLTALVALGLLMLAWPLAASIPVALLLVALAGVADGPTLSATFAVRQRYAPRALHGQVFTTAASLKVGSFALGSAVAGPAVVGLGADGALVLAASLQLAAAVAGLAAMRIPLRVRTAEIS